MKPPAPISEERRLAQERFLESAAAIPLDEMAHYAWLQLGRSEIWKREDGRFLWFQRDLRLAAGMSPLPRPPKRLDERSRSARMEERRARVIELGMRGLDDEAIAAELGLRAEQVPAMRGQAFRDGVRAVEPVEREIPGATWIPGWDPMGLFR